MPQQSSNGAICQPQSTQSFDDSLFPPVNDFYPKPLSSNVNNIKSISSSKSHRKVSFNVADDEAQALRARLALEHSASQSSYVPKLKTYEQCTKNLTGNRSLKYSEGKPLLSPSSNPISGSSYKNRRRRFSSLLTHKDESTIIQPTSQNSPDEHIGSGRSKGGLIKSLPNKLWVLLTAPRYFSLETEDYINEQCRQEGKMEEGTAGSISETPPCAMSGESIGKARRLRLSSIKRKPTTKRENLVGLGMLRSSSSYFSQPSLSRSSEIFSDHPGKTENVKIAKSIVWLDVKICDDKIGTLYFGTLYFEVSTCPK